jgi:hypothetical protein
MFAKRLCVWLQLRLTCGSNMIVKNIEKRRHTGCWLGDICSLPPATLGSLLGSCSIRKKHVHATNTLLMSWHHKITWTCCILRSLPCVLLCTFSAFVKLLQDSQRVFLPAPSNQIRNALTKCGVQTWVLVIDRRKTAMGPMIATIVEGARPRSGRGSSSPCCRGGCASPSSKYGSNGGYWGARSSCRLGSSCFRKTFFIICILGRSQSGEG